MEGWRKLGRHTAFADMKLVDLTQIQFLTKTDLNGTRLLQLMMMIKKLQRNNS